MSELSYEDGVIKGMQMAADFLEREADANFMPNEPAKVLLKTFAVTIRRNLAASGMQPVGKKATDEHR